jgi:O-antigen/teichoic acid export membrane protein
MVLLSLVAGVVNYASNLAFGRLLTPAEFGDLTALLSLAVIASVPAFAAQTRVAERLATHRARGDVVTAAYSIRHNSAHVTLYALLIGVVALAAAPLTKSALSLQAIGPAIAVAPLLVVTFLTPLALGLLQGLERLVLLGVFMLAIALSRLIVGVVWVEGGGGSGGAVAGQALGAAAALLFVAWIVRPEQAQAPTGAATAGVRRRIDAPAVSATAAFVAFALLSNFDVVLAKLALSPQASGEYAALSTIGKIVLFLPSAVAVVMVPRAARRREQGDSASREPRRPQPRSPPPRPWSARCLARVTSKQPMECCQSC